MSLSFYGSILRPLAFRWPLLLYAAAWTAVLSATVAVASFLPEAAFIWAISPSSSFSRACDAEGFVRVPMDLPGEVLCLPSHLFAKFSMDLLVPPVFAAVVVAGSACLVRAMCLWEDDLPRWVRLWFWPETQKSLYSTRGMYTPLLWDRHGIWIDLRSMLCAVFIPRWFLSFFKGKVATAFQFWFSDTKSLFAVVFGKAVEYCFLCCNAFILFRVLFFFLMILNIYKKKLHF